jgi:hypothetical protein
MYQRHSLIFFVFTILVSIVVVGALIALKRLNKLPLPQWLVSLLPWLITLQVVMLFGVGSYDNWRLREELRNVAPAGVGELVLSRGNLTAKVTDKTEIAKLLSLIQTVARAAAHHSHPTDEFDVTFEFKGQVYHYRLGRDSKKDDEYWVFRAGQARAGNQDLEIGRVQSSLLGPTVANLLPSKN